MSTERWNIGLPGGPSGPFYSIVSESGRVIAMQIPSKEVAEHIIDQRERIRLLERAQELLCDVINQACQEEFDDQGSIISDLALSSYEDAIAYLEDVGRAIRMPGKLLRWRLTWPESPAAGEESEQ